MKTILLAVLLSACATVPVKATNAVSTDVPVAGGKPAAKALPAAPPNLLKEIQDRRDQLKVFTDQAAAEAAINTGHPASIVGLYFPNQASATTDMAISLMKLTEGKTEVTIAAIFRYVNGKWDVVPLEFYPYNFKGD